MLANCHKGAVVLGSHRIEILLADRGTHINQFCNYSKSKRCDVKSIIKYGTGS